MTSTEKATHIKDGAKSKRQDPNQTTSTETGTQIKDRSKSRRQDPNQTTLVIFIQFNVK